MRTQAPGFSRFPLIAFCLAFAGLAVRAQQFAQPVIIPTGNWPVSIVAGDAEPKDGITDLLYCDPGVLRISTGCHLLAGASNGTFVKSQDFGGNRDEGVYTATFMPFSATVNYPVTFSSRRTIPNSMDIVEEYGDGKFLTFSFSTLGTRFDIPGPIQYLSYRTDNTGNRGWLAEETNNGYLYSVDIGGTVRDSILLPDGTGPVITGDFNGDGFTDVLVLGTTNNVINLYTGNGDGTFTASARLVIGGGIYSMLVRDMDGDGIPDLIVDGFKGKISIMQGTSTGFSSTATPLLGAENGANGHGGHLIGIADLNGDGILDIVTSTPAGIGVMLGQGSLRYQLDGIYNAGPGRSSYVFTDLNGDGHPDIAIDSPEGIAILFGNPDGSFQTSRSYSAGQPAYSLALGRFSGASRGQGPVDAVVATGIPQFQVLSGDDKGGFSITTPPWPAGAAQTNSTRTLWSSVIPSYLDSDSILDLAVTENGKPSAADTAGITLYYGYGDRTFTTPVVADPSGSNHIGASSVGTFNTDGVVHVLTFDTSACGSFSLASRATVPGTTFNANPTGSPYNLVTPGYLTVGSAYVSKNDIVCEINGSLYVYKNDGNGAFLPPVVLPAPPGVATADASGVLPAKGLFPSALLFADLDGDNFGDLIAIYHNLASDPAHPTSATPNQIYIYWGKGDGTFATPAILTTTRNYYQASIAELDGDFHPDLILSDGYIVSVLPGGGLSRSFGAEQHYLAGMGINGISTYPVNAQNLIVVANGGDVLSNPAINRGTLDTNAEVNTGGITVLLASTAPTFTAPAGTLTANPSNPGYGHTFTLTATITSPSGGIVPTGTVNFSIDGVVVTTAANLDSTGVATYTVNSPTYPVGPHTLTAVYSGDSTYTTLTLTGTVNVTLLPTETDMTNIVTPIFYGQIIGDIAVGHAAALNPTDTEPLDQGTLTFYINGINVCVLPYISGQTQSCPATTGAGYNAGSYTLSAMYSGNQYYSSSMSPNYPVVVLPDDTQGTLASSRNPATVGQAVTFTATFTALYATPVGTVTFFDGATSIGTGTLSAAGAATLTTSTLTIGTHPITASLTASQNFNGSTTTPLQQVITPPVDPINTTTTGLTSSINPSNVGQAVTFTATVTPQSGNGIPTGSITFSVDGVFIGTVALNAQGTASITNSTLTAGSHIIAASYPGSPAGSPSYLSSAATIVQQVNAIVAGNFTLTVTPATLSVPIGNSAIAVVTVTALNGFSQPVALSCANLPREVTCTFDSTTIPAGGGITHLTVSATAPHDCNNTSPYFVSSGPTGWLGLLASSGLILLLRRRRKLIGAIVLTLALCILPATIGCGNCTDLGVYPGNYSFTVTGTSTGPTPATATQSISMTAHL